jgi:DNA processing protein
LNPRLRLAWLGLHPDRARKLVDRLGGPDRVLAAMEAGEVKLGEGPRRRLAATASEIVSAIGAAEVRFRETLPAQLRDLPDSPDLLFVRGEIPDVPGVAIVGSRHATAYGRRLARAFGRAIGMTGWLVISGLARGVDGEAHRGCLEGGGVGVAVLGSGIDVIYPAENRQLADDLLAGGGSIVSEAPPGVAPEGWRFPPRNRIISGLAEAIVVVEAAERSGALITAGKALEQGRAVLAVPGDVDRDTSRGCNLLIRDGAHPVLGVEDLLQGLGITLGAPPGLGDDDHPVLRHLTVGLTIAELAARLGWPLPRTLVEVGKLEAAGAIRNEGGLLVLTERENMA